MLENVNPDLSDSEFDPDIRNKRGSSAGLDFFDGAGTPNFGADAPTPGGADGLDMEEGDGEAENDEGSDDDLAAELERALAGEDEGDEDEEEEDEDEDETDEEEEEDGDAELTQGECPRRDRLSWAKFSWVILQPRNYYMKKSKILRPSSKRRPPKLHALKILSSRFVYCRFRYSMLRLTKRSLSLAWKLASTLRNLKPI